VHRRKFILESSSAGVIGVDAKGRIQSWNAGARRIFGYARGEILGSPISRLLPPENRRGMARLLSFIKRHSWIEYRETTCVKKDGHLIDVGFTGLPEETLVPGRHGVLIVLHDITPRREMERALKDEAERSDSAEHLARVGSWEWNVSTDTFVWSDEFREMMDLDRSLRRSTFKRIVRRIRPEDRKTFATAIRNTLRKKVPFECRCGVTRADGSILQVLLRGRLILGPGRRTRLVGISQHLRDLPGDRAQVLASGLRGLKGVQSRGVILARASLVLFSGFSIEDALLRAAKAIVPALADRCTIDLVEKEDSVLRVRAMRTNSGRRQHPAWVERERLTCFPLGPAARVFETGEYELHSTVTSHTVPSLLPDPASLAIRPGAIPTSLLFIPLHSHRGRIGVVTFVQVESKRRFETDDVLVAQRLAQLISLAVEHCRLYANTLQRMQDLRKRDRSLAELNRTLENQVEKRTSELKESLGDMEWFARTVAHDLRAPLRGISGLAEALVEDVGSRLGLEGSALASRIQEGCGRMNALIQDILAYSRASHLEIALEPLDLAAIVDTAERQMAADLAARRAVIVAPGPFPRVIAHAGLLVQAVANLLDNASKFVAPGITPSIQVRAERHEDRVRLLIEDNGIGVDPEYADRIFKAFERLHSTQAYPGTGLGLAIVRRCVERMRGKVGLEPRPTGGSIFFIELPAAPEDALPGSPTA
jgi:PAS domain S-box-containing protein